MQTEKHTGPTCLPQHEPAEHTVCVWWGSHTRDLIDLWLGGEQGQCPL